MGKKHPRDSSVGDVPERVVRDAIESGRLPAIKIGRQIRVRRSDLFLVRGGDQ